MTGQAPFLAISQKKLLAPGPALCSSPGASELWSHELQGLGNEREILPSALYSLVVTHAKLPSEVRTGCVLISVLAWVQSSLLCLLYPEGLMRHTVLPVSLGCAGVSGTAAERGLLLRGINCPSLSTAPVYLCQHPALENLSI